MDAVFSIFLQFLSTLINLLLVSRSHLLLQIFGNVAGGGYVLDLLKSNIPSNGVTLMGGDAGVTLIIDNLIKVIISIPNMWSQLSDCQLCILPCLSD